MKIQILDEAEQDLVDGSHFYEAHDEGLGDYFLRTREWKVLSSAILQANLHSRCSIWKNGFIEAGIGHEKAPSKEKPLWRVQRIGAAARDHPKSKGWVRRIFLCIH